MPIKFHTSNNKPAAEEYLEEDEPVEEVAPTKTKKTTAKGKTKASTPAAVAAPGRPTYTKAGRVTLFATPRGDNKPTFEGFIILDDVDIFGGALIVTLFEPKEGSKCVASGSAKIQDENGEAQVVLWVSMLEGKDDSLYALMNVNGADKKAEPWKLSLYQDENCEWRFSGAVSIPD